MMTIKRLSKYYYIKQNIQSIRERLEELETCYKSAGNLSGMPHSPSNENPLEIKVEKIIILKEKLQHQLDKLIDEEIELQTFIDNIDDVKIQMIVRMRFIELKSWHEISKIIYKYADKTLPLNNLKNYLKKYNKNLEVNDEVKVKM